MFVIKYSSSRAILHVPFVPFSILFTHTVQNFDEGDLSLLEQFAASLKTPDEATKSITHPYRLYSLLCEAARLYIASKPNSFTLDSSLPIDDDDALIQDGFGVVPGGAVEPNDVSIPDLTDWYLGNQQLMGLLDGFISF